MKLKKFVHKVMDDDLPTLAASLAYYSALSIAPLAVVTLVVLSYLPTSLETIVDQIRFLFGDPAAQIATRLFEQSQKPTARSLASFLSIFVSIVFASAMFVQLQASLNKIFEVKSRPIRVWFFKRIQSMGLVFIFILLLFLSAFALKVLEKYSPEFLEASVGDFLRFALLVLSPILLFKFLPETRTYWIPSCIGGLLVGVLFEVGNQFLVSYLKESAAHSAYGAMGSLLAFLLWIYYSAIILLFGAEISRYFSSTKVNR